MKLHTRTQNKKFLAHTIVVLLLLFHSNPGTRVVAAIEGDLPDPSGCVCADGSKCVIDAEHPTGYCSPSSQNLVTAKKSNSESHRRLRQ